MKISTLASIVLPAALAALPAGGAVYDVEASNAAAIQDALWTVATDNEPGEVVVPAGTYLISSALRIYPNTTLTLDENAVVRYAGAADGSMLVGCHLDESGASCSGDDCPHGGYTQCHDVVVQGGLWDRSSTADELSQAFVFRHASGITIRDLTVEHCSNHHFNLSGSEDVVVDNVCFSGQVRYTGHRDDFWLTYAYGDESRYYPIEAIHLDYLDSIGEASARPLDQTPCRNILVTNCIFDAVFSGVGVHHIPLGEGASGICVADCYFHDLLSFSVYMWGVDDGAVENNTATGGLGILQANQSGVRVSGNDISGSKQYGVFARNGSRVSIVGNRFLDTELRAVHIEQSTATVTDNTVEGTGDNSILLNGSPKAVVDRNTVTDSGKIAILAMSGSKLYARNNTILSPGTHGIFSTGGSSLTASGNTIRSAGKNGIAADGGTANLSGNRILSPGLHGIFGYNSARVTATSNTIEKPAACGFAFQSKAKLTAGGNNIVKNPKKQGVLLSSAGASTISGMQITGSGSDGIRVVQTPGCTVSKNTVTGVKGKKAGIVMEQCKSGTVTGNTVAGSTGHGIRIIGTKAIPSTVTVSKNRSTGAGAPYMDIILGDWSRKCKVLNNTLGLKRFKISTTGTSGNTYRPVGTSLTKAARKTKTAATVKWASQPQADGFEIQYSTSKKFTKPKTASARAGKTAKTIKNLVATKKYWFRIRTFHKVGTKKYYSSWSAAKSVKP